LDQVQRLLLELLVLLLDVLTLNSSSSFTAAVTASSIVNAASKTATFSDAVTANITNSGTLLFDTSADKSVTGTIAEASRWRHYRN
jgi:hypothetical protein